MNLEHRMANPLENSPMTASPETTELPQISESHEEITRTAFSRRALLRMALLSPLAAYAGRYIGEIETVEAQNQRGRTPFPHTLPPLPYSYSALNRAIDTKTMQLHHDKHHNAYVTNLNKAIREKAPNLSNRTAQELIRNLDNVPEGARDAIRNNAGGHVNHSMFWRIMSPRGGGVPTGEIARAINRSFGSFAAFKDRFNEAGLARFGSGWVWLVRDGNDFKIMTTPNQDNPMMEEHGRRFPVMGNDVWEHAYYLRYNNRRADYLKAWWNVVNWDEINRRLQASGSWS
jgi:Fe-Mn family superoxide dismutase